MKIISFFITIQLFNNINFLYISQALPRNLYFEQNTPQMNIDLNFQTNQETINQYSIWGWLKFSGAQLGITNFLILQSRVGNNGSINPLNPQNDPNFPNCPFTQIELEQQPQLKDLSEVIGNPNCFSNQQQIIPQNNNLIDILYLNFDLETQSSYSLVALLQNGLTRNNQSQILVEGFSNLKFNPNSWIYFGISCDYRSGQAFFIMQEFNGNVQPQSKQIQLNFPNFQLNKNSLLILANKNSVPYFQTNTFFVGNLAYIEYAPFFTQELSTIWYGFMDQNSQQFHGILREFFFDVYEKGQQVDSYGFYKDKISLIGDCEPLFLSNRNQIGIRVKENCEMSLGNMDFRNQEQIQTMNFYFNLQYQEQLRNDYLLLERGRDNQNGNIKIYLSQNQLGRVIKVDLYGDNQSITWESTSIILEKTKVEIIIGIIKSPANSLHIAYYDSNQKISKQQISSFINFDTRSQSIQLFKQNSPEKNSGFIDIYRFSIQNSAGSVLFKILQTDIKSQELNIQNDKCKIRNDLYSSSFFCISCEKSFLNFKNGQCESFCSNGTRSASTGVCVDCKNQCLEIPTTKWNIEKINSNHFRLKPNNRIQNLSSYNADQIFSVNILGKENTNFTYDTQIIDNEQEQYIDYKFDFRDKLENDTLVFNVNQNQQQYDVNGNLIYQESITHKIDICYLTNKKKQDLRGLSITILVLFLFTLIVLILFSLFFKSKLKFLGYYWKMFLHIWMNFQVFVFFYFIGVVQPCCLNYFYHILYLITVKWDYCLRGSFINDYSGDNFSGEIEFYRQPEKQFKIEQVSAWILANMGLLFIFHLVLFVLYVVFKILAFSKQGGLIKAICKIIEYTILIIFFLLFHMQIFVFSTINLRQFGSSNHSFFIFCLLISIGYIVVFSLFWLYSVFRMIGSSFYFQDIKNKSYKAQKLAFTFDLWKVLAHFIIGVVIGTAWNYPRVQTSIIFVVLTLLLIYLIIIRPWEQFWQNIIEIFFTLILWLISIFYLSMAHQDGNGCSTCLDREGLYCWFIVILIFLACLLSLLGLIGFIILSLIKPNIFSQSDSTTYTPISQTIVSTIQKKDHTKDKNSLLKDYLNQSKLRQSHLKSQQYSQNHEIKTTEDLINSISNQQIKPVKHVPLTMQADQDISYMSNNSGYTLNQDNDDYNREQTHILQTLKNPRYEEEEVPSFKVQPQ